MSIVTFIPLTERPANRELVREISRAIFGSAESADFAEEYVPHSARVPYPKADQFSQFLLRYPKCLWAVFENDKKERVAGFVLISDLPHINSVGFGINPDYAGKGIMLLAWNEIILNSEQCISFPLNAYTSQRNKPAIRFLDKIGFVPAGNIEFQGDPSFKYVYNR